MDDLTDERIKKVNSPKNRCGDRHVVVYKDEDEQWAIVALDWDGKPGLAIRWFWNKLGFPISYGHPTWFIIPIELYDVILNGLPLEVSFKNKINRFLAGEITGNELKEGV